ncbi:hypothetical protein AVEN_254285-1 [Araneus ventricosus]|uniref:Uncharacterized protein n=1 Tax=Araneus ventricosus TaxID=182803 RepID=A0A4Y2FD36_ARAVE|nr:hypothetical protein AVEN_254285-1 [Araneus ventricosus]
MRELSCFPETTTSRRAHTHLIDSGRPRMPINGSPESVSLTATCLRLPPPLQQKRDGRQETESVFCNADWGIFAMEVRHRSGRQKQRRREGALAPSLLAEKN